MDLFHLAIPDISRSNTGNHSIQRLSAHEFEGLNTLASSLGLTTAERFNGSAKPRQLVQLLSCKQEIHGRSLWNANGLFTKSYKCLEEAARAFRALCTKLVAALGMALLSLAGAGARRGGTCTDGYKALRPRAFTGRGPARIKRGAAAGARCDKRAGGAKCAARAEPASGAKRVSHPCT